MYNHNFLNPIRHTQSSVFSNIGVPVSARKVTTNNPKKESNLINKRIDNIKRQQQSLTSLLQEKEREEIETLAKIEKARKQRENIHKILSSALDHSFTNKFTLLHHTGMVQALYIWLV